MNNRVLFGILCIIFNSCGVPCFLQGEIKKGIIRILLGIVTFGIIGLINFVKGIFFGIEVLKMSDAEFHEKKQTLSSGFPA